VGAALTTIFVIRDAVVGHAGLLFGVEIALWLWFTVLFANFAEAMAEARGKAQGRLAAQDEDRCTGQAHPSDGTTEQVLASRLRAGDVVLCDAGDVIPGDGEVIEASPPSTNR
jgi:K+-transporting ATPase ATPase B chain